MLARPTVTPWHTHTHTPGLTAPRALQALRSAGSPVSPPGGQLCSSPIHIGLPQHALLPAPRFPSAPWTQVARVLWNPGHSLVHTQPAGLSHFQEPSENSRDFRRACHCTRMHCTHVRGQGRRPQQQHPRAGAVGSATRQGAKREPPTVGCTCLPSLQRSQLTGARSSRQQTLIGTPNTAWSSFPAARRGSMWPIYPAWRTG